MGDLIVMSRPKPFPARDYAASHSAEILFFTGVRYYRVDEAAEAAKLANANAVGGKRSPAKRRRSLEPLTASKRLREKRLQEALA